MEVLNVQAQVGRGTLEEALLLLEAHEGHAIIDLHAHAFIVAI